MRAAKLRAACLALLAGGPASVCHAGEALQPYQMVRSLQLVQDRIAAGDHAALPMQARLIEMVDARMRTASPDDFKDAKNFRALLIYGMSGGNPVTVESAAARAAPDAGSKTIADAVIDYLSGRPAAAIAALKPVEPMTLPSDIGAFVALVKGSLLAAEDPVQALSLLDKARLLSPGTLVEEAALRRSVGIAAANGDAARFALASTQYAEHYLYSPYASQFADSFVSGVIALHMAISQDKLADITSMMDAEREKVIYLRIARRAAIDGLNDLSTFASAKAEQGRDGKANDGDPRALLYASLSTVTSATIGDLKTRLKKIDRSQLSEDDRSLLDAARTIADKIIAVPSAPTAPPVASAAVPKTVSPTAGDKPPPATPADGAAPAPSKTTDQADGADLPPVEGEVSEKPADGGAQPAPVNAADAAMPAKPTPVETKQAAVQPAAAPDDPADVAIADTRRKLEQIDQILGAAPQ